MTVCSSRVYFVKPVFTGFIPLFSKQLWTDSMGHKARVKRRVQWYCTQKFAVSLQYFTLMHFKICFTEELWCMIMVKLTEIHFATNYKGYLVAEAFILILLHIFCRLENQLDKSSGKYCHTSVTLVVACQLSSLLCPLSSMHSTGRYTKEQHLHHV